MEEATHVALERLESTQRREAAATEARIAQLTAAINELRASGRRSATPETTQPVATTEGYTAYSTAPDGGAGHDATRGPLAALTPSLPSPAQVSTPLALPTEEQAELTAEGEQIDLDRLTDLLTARLGQLNLPRAE